MGWGGAQLHLLGLHMNVLSGTGPMGWVVSPCFSLVGFFFHIPSSLWASRRVSLGGPSRKLGHGPTVVLGTQRTRSVKHLSLCTFWVSSQGSLVASGTSRSYSRANTRRKFCCNFNKLCICLKLFRVSCPIGHRARPVPSARSTFASKQEH